MKRRTPLIVLAVAVIIGIASLFSPPARAQATAPAPQLPQGVIQGVQVTAATTPVIQQGLPAIQQAQQSGDPAATIQAAGDLITKATAAAGGVPTPISPYLILASVISSLATPIVAGIFGLFMHKSNQAAHATAQAAVSAP